MTKTSDIYTHVWRIRHVPTGEFRKSGNKKYSRTGRSVWPDLQQAVRAYQAMTPGYRADCVLVQYKLVEVAVMEPLKLG